MVNLDGFEKFRFYRIENAKRICKDYSNKFFLLEFGKTNNITEKFYSHKSSLNRALKKYAKYDNSFGGPFYSAGKVSDLEKLVDVNSFNKKVKEINHYIQKIEMAHKSASDSTLQFD